MRSGTSIVGCMVLLACLLAVSGAVVGQDATQQDLQETENRLIDQVLLSEANLTTDLADGIANLTDRVAALEASVADTNSSTSIAALLADLRIQMEAFQMAVLVAIEANGTQVLQDHKHIYSALAAADGTPLLHDVKADQEALIHNTLLLREDVGAVDKNVTTSANVQSRGAAQILEAADSGSGKGTFSTILLVFLAVAQAAQFAYVTKRPRSFWRWLGHEARTVENRGAYVAPPCPKDDKGMEFGQFYQCPFAEDCAVADQCQIEARNRTEHRILDAPTGPVVQLAKEAPDEDQDEVPDEESPAVTVVEKRRDLSKFGA